jgi:hypothetical protein
MLADEPDERNEDEVREGAAGAQEGRRPQAHHVAQAQDEGDRVEAQEDPRLLVDRGEGRHELEVQHLLPDGEGRHEEVVDGRDPRRLQEQLRLRAALLARDEDLGDRGRLGIRELAVHVADEVAAQGNEKQDAQAAAGETDEDRLPGMGIELQDVERGQGEDRSRDHGARNAADAGDDDVLKEARAPAVDAGQADRENRDGSRPP